MKSSIYAELSVINPTSIYRPNYFHQSLFHFNKERFPSNVRVAYNIDFGLISSIFNVFATQQRFLSSLQLRVIKELFHQSSFYLKNSSLYLRKVIKIFLRGKSSGGKCTGENVRGGNVLDPF